MSDTKTREILCTVGPASLNASVLVRLEELGVDLFRINLSHTRIKDLPQVVSFIRSHSSVPICLDTEGAQIRTGDLVSGEIVLRENTTVFAHRERVPGDSNNFNLYPLDIVDQLEEGDFISVDFNAVLVQVTQKLPDRVAMRVIHGGVVGRNKAVTVERDLPLAPLTAKDIEALKWGRENGIRHVALSFANRGSDVDAVRALVGDDTFLISKIECRNALHNLDDIAQRSDALLIDRGDLSRQEPIERIPSLQKMIIRRGGELRRRVYVATNLLESMISAPRPTRAEVNDVVNTLLDGADGLVLAAETAIGRDPVGCVGMILKLIHEYEAYRLATAEAPRHYRASDGLSLLVSPHGGQLVEQHVPQEDHAAVEALPKLAVSARVLQDAQHIALGTFSPLRGFMDEATLESVLQTHRLPDGTPWPMPILLPLAADREPAEGPVVLTDEAGTAFAVVTDARTFSFDTRELALKWFGTTSDTHPGARETNTWSGRFLTGKVSVLQRLPSAHREYELTPRESRFVLQHKGWRKVIGFQARGPATRLDEHVQIAALERHCADGLFLNLGLEIDRAHSFPADAVLSSYRMMLDFGYYPGGKVTLGVQPLYPRHAGAREQVFHALCHKNLGCSHYLFDPAIQPNTETEQTDDVRALLASIGDLGITPICVGQVEYDPETQGYVERDGRKRRVAGRRTALHPKEASAALSRNELLPEWFMRESIQDMLRSRLTSIQLERRHVFAH
ncbi:MAG: sulfate adenylyltransferase [Thauera sp.]|nr:sulfate adenylyltransferase [Thauera sp.]